MLPRDPFILLSFVNTKLRNEYDSLQKLCAALEVDVSTLCRTLASVDYRYDPDQKRFI